MNVSPRPRNAPQVQLRPGMTGYSALMRAANTTSASAAASAPGSVSGSAPAAGFAAPVMEHSIPWSYLDTSFQAVPFGPSLRALKCMWPGFTWRGEGAAGVGVRHLGVLPNNE